MLDFYASDFESTFDYFLLSGFTSGPRSLSEIARRVQGVERLLDAAAARKGQPRRASLPVALERLRHAGLLQAEQLLQRPDPELIYSLTDAGKERLARERARRQAIVSHFVEDSDLDGSFLKFLNRNSLPGIQ